MAIIFALALTALIGAVALGVETGLWYSAKRSLQTAADAAALSGAYEIHDGQTDYASAAAIDAGRNGYSTANGTTITVNNPPASGSYTTDNNAVEVILSQPQSLLLARVISGGASTLTVTARAVATQATTASGPYCVLGLDQSAADTVELSQNATAPNSQCGIASNSTSPTGLQLLNNAAIAGPVAVAGSQYALSNNATLGGNVSEGSVTVDPYASVQPTPPTTCETGQTTSAMNQVTVNLIPGRFCSGLDFMNGATVNMAPGTYYIDSQFTFMNNAVLNATGGVSIVFDSDFAMNVGNNAVLNITAPTSGSLTGIAMMGPRNGSTSTNQVFSNNAVLNVDGALYFPSQTVTIENNGSTSSSACTQVIGDMVSLSNNVNLPSNCSASGYPQINQVLKVQLVE